MLKRVSLFTVIVSGLLFHTIGWAVAGGNFSGNWRYVEHIDGSSKPYSTFDIHLNQTSDGALTGSYCFVTQNGNRIDCDRGGANNIVGHVGGDGRHATVSFYSFFGAKGGVATLADNGDFLTWKVTSNPSGDFFYGPYNGTLVRKKSDTLGGKRQVMVDKAYLYPTPSETKVKSYLVKGDNVELHEVSDNFKFWRISYSSKNGIEIERWIDCHAINFCP